MARVFLSFASEDCLLAGELHSWLGGLRHEVFFDRDLHDGVVVGDRWRDRLHERLRWADAVVCVVTAAYAGSVWCSAEVGIAGSRGALLMPLLAERDVEHPLLPSSLVQLADYAADPEAALEKVAEALRQVDAAGGRGWPDDRSPYPGLRPLDTDWNRVFFGRRAETEALARLLRSPAEQAEGGLVVVVGPSGCGKSSLVRAGLLPKMAAEPGWWVLPAVLPGADPVAALARELTETGVRLGIDWSLRQVRERLAGAGGLVEVADELLLAVPGGGRRRLLVVLDQYEELLTRVPPAGRARFAGLLRPALAGPVQVVATLRPEFLSPLLADPDLAGVPPRVFPLRPLLREALAGVITEPAQVAGIDIDAELVDRLVADTGSGQALPLLAFALAQLADGVIRGGRLSADRYDQLGGVRAALVRQADAALAEAQATTGRTAGEVLAGLLRLVTVDEHGHPTGRRVARDQLLPPVAAEMDAFVTRRLVTSDTGDRAGGTVMIGVAHEAVLSAWPPLADAIAAAGAALRARRAVEQAATDWQNNHRPRTRLWERRQLAAALADTGAHLQPANASTQWPAHHGPHTAGRRLVSRVTSWLPGLHPRVLISDNVDLTPQAREFLHTSIRRDRRRRARALTVLSALLAAALTAATVTSLALHAAQQQRHAAEQQRHAAEQNQILAIARQLTAQADTMRGVNDRTAMLLGIAAQHLHDDPDTRTSLRNTVIATHYAQTLYASDEVSSVAFSPDGRTLATGSRDKTAILWDLTDRAHPARLGAPLTGHNGPVSSVAFSPDGRTLATGSDDHTVILWDLTDQAHPARLGAPLTGHNDVVLSVAFSPDGRTLATASRDKTVILWDLTDRNHPTRLGTPLTGHQDSVWSVAFSPDGWTLATASWDKTVILWDLTDLNHPTRLGTSLTGHNGPVVSVAFSPDGRTLATGSADKTVILWDLTDRNHPTPLGTPLTGHNDVVASVAFSPDGRALATGSEDNTAILWDLTDRAHPARLGAPLTGHTGRVWSVAFSPDGRTLATGSADHTVILWDLTDQAHPARLGAPLTGHNGPVWSVAFSPDGRTLATGSADHTVILWDLTDRAHPTRLGTPLTGHNDAVWSVAFSPDSRTLAIGSADKTVILWDLTDRAHPTRLGAPLTGHQDSVDSVAFSPDGRALATGSEDRTVILWDLTDRAHPTRLGTPLTGHQDSVVSVAFSPDGRTLATGSAITAILWNLTDRAHPTRLGAPLTGHNEAVWSVAFSPDGRTLATASVDRTVILWDLTDRAHPTRLGTPLTGHQDSLWSVAFSPDGRTLATASADKTAILWDLTTLNTLLRSNPLAAACSIIGRDLTAEEWKQYITGQPYQHTCPA